MPFSTGYKLTTVRNDSDDVKVGVEQPLQSFSENFMVVSYQQPWFGHTCPPDMDKSEEICNVAVIH
jgi:hypothetical protein